MDQRLIQDCNIGENLKRLRKKAGFTQLEVSAKLQVMGLPVSREIYAQIESGKHHIKIRVLLGLKRIYKATYEELLEDETGERNIV
ncbi:MAG: helix-turn-helix transcriptional regulator [Clostridiales bacterium]|nr:helix-turn-helix transcriptional regulator [Clostridiales bacterium]